MTENMQSETHSAAAGDGLDPKVGGLVAYLTWVGGLIMLLTQKHREVRFHAAQSILLSIALVAVYIVLGIVQLIAGLILWWLGALFSIVYGIVGLASLALWIFLIIKGYNLVHVKLPLIGDMAEKWAAK
ncbi:membrane protein [Microbacterium faecale]|uniref:Membrane protein n=1 Tax=Microbacterium faecale TaxID=1804630 RepID=A0A917DEQ3_9MICO|nr:DUF4870 domain-containing protein [Microbacterium faecale]GGD34090.1 membrane protein [Microbacterium faecale]HJB63026.1 DUF4870 domain-containing protein [Candidatus Microbacterium pullistercoris]